MEVKDAVDDDGGEGGEEDAALEKTSSSSITHIMRACPATFRTSKYWAISSSLSVFLLRNWIKRYCRDRSRESGKYEWTIFSLFLLHYERIRGRPLLFLLAHFPISDLPPI